ncbi:MAG: glycoside hydrolase family 97 N-terminal domain-containing protein, partial [Planctomycetales bacterium]|nr:glycoside hydrolase family 97 N-terminal domain-containing protein [Planctomycetales bacterium]
MQTSRWALPWFFLQLVRLACPRRGLLASTTTLALSLSLPSDACLAAVVASPDGRIVVDVQLVADGDRSRLQYAASFDDTPVIQASTIAFEASNGDAIGAHLALVSSPTPSLHNGVWTPVYGERGSIRDDYRQLAFELRDEVSGHRLEIEFRCYDSGFAFRTRLHAASEATPLGIQAERSEFRFTADHTIWSTPAAQGKHVRTTLAELSDAAERPLLIRVQDNLYAAIGEAALVDYAPIRLRRDERDPHCLTTQLRGPIAAAPVIETPWRVVMLGRSAGELL